MNGLRAFRCAECNSVWFPERLACAVCQGVKFHQEIVEKGILRNKTTRGDGKVVIATVEITGGVRVVGELVGEMKIGQLVDVVSSPGIPDTFYVPDDIVGLENTSISKNVATFEQTVPRLLQRQSDKYGDKKFLEVNGKEVSYSAMLDLAARAGGAFRDRGIGPGAGIAILCGNRLEFIQTLFGAAWLNATVIPLNTSARGENLRHSLDDSGARALVIEEQHLETLIDLESLPMHLREVWVIGSSQRGGT